MVRELVGESIGDLVVLIYYLLNWWRVGWKICWRFGGVGLGWVGLGWVLGGACKTNKTIDAKPVSFSFLDRFKTQTGIK